MQDLLYFQFRLFFAAKDLDHPEQLLDLDGITY